MGLHELPKIVKGKKRLGRGLAGRGTKSGRGQKGQRSRAGNKTKIGFEGGQTPLYMRLPKELGTKQWRASRVKKPQAIKVGKLNEFEDGSVVGIGQLRKKGFLDRETQTIKLIIGGELKKKLTVRVSSASEAAVTAVEKAGGKVEMVK
jgi:large subunit ribosomal protein L15